MVCRFWCARETHHGSQPTEIRDWTALGIKVSAELYGPASSAGGLSTPRERFENPNSLTKVLQKILSKRLKTY